MDQHRHLPCVRGCLAGLLIGEALANPGAPLCGPVAVGPLYAAAREYARFDIGQGNFDELKAQHHASMGEFELGQAAAGCLEGVESPEAPEVRVFPVALWVQLARQYRPDLFLRSEYVRSVRALPAASAAARAVGFLVAPLVYLAPMHAAKVLEQLPGNVGRLHYAAQVAPHLERLYPWALVGLYAFLRQHRSLSEGLALARRLAPGDRCASALAGALIGAHLGPGALPPELYARIPAEARRDIASFGP